MYRSPSRKDLIIEDVRRDANDRRHSKQKQKLVVAVAIVASTNDNLVNLDEHHTNNVDNVVFINMAMKRYQRNIKIHRNKLKKGFARKI